MPNNLRAPNQGHIYRVLMAMEEKNQIIENLHTTVGAYPTIISVHYEYVDTKDVE